MPRRTYRIFIPTATWHALHRLRRTLPEGPR